MVDRSHLKTILGSALSVAILIVALWFLHRELAGLSTDALLHHVRAIPPLALVMSLCFAACSYLVLTAYDATALRYLNSQITYRRSALTAFMAFAVGHNVGLAALSGGSIRYRMYTLAGLSATEVARVILFVTVTFGLGASGLLGSTLLLMPAAQTAVLRIPPGLISVAGVLLLSVPITYVLVAFARRRPITFRSWQLAWPRPTIALTQIAISMVDLTFAAATLYVLLAPELHIGFLPFLGIFLLAMGAGVISSVPGGIGVFEAVLVALLPQVNSTALLAIILVYRLIYYVGPLVLALILLVAHELRQHGQAILKPAAAAGNWLSGIAPQIIGVAVFLAGVVLLVSGASPAIETRLHVLTRGIPLPVLELSHMTGSVVGVGLLILARGLMRRLQGAYYVAFGALLLGAAVSLVKGMDFEEALLLCSITVVMYISRNEFYRTGSMAAESFSMQWVAAIVIAIGLSVWIGLLSHRHVEYSDQLWWEFALEAEAPRMLRASLLAAIAALAFMFWKILHRGRRDILSSATPDEAENIRKVLASTTDAAANVALLPDKRFLWSEGQRAFIMYQICGKSWIAMGGPVGPAECHEELAWSFREMVDRHDGRPVFYQVSEQSLSLWVDLGLTLAKLGEDARVPLDGFSLQGSHRADLRQAVNRAARNGATFAVVPRSDVPSILAELRTVSDSWLNDKATAEKGFSLGSFSDAYIANFDCAVVRVDGAIVAFANLWPAPAGGELSVDLMRYTQQAPKGVMDYLFAQLMLWGSANNYRWFNLGMAPLSGMERRPLAPLWQKLGHLAFTHGESFYNFEGLRSYKEKFEPEWTPRYLACPGGVLNVPQALLDAARLVSGGFTKILKK